MSEVQIVFGVLLLGVAGFIYLAVMVNKQKKEHLDKLKSEGFEVEHFMKGVTANIAVDTTNQAIAFIFANSVNKVNFEDVISWKHTYVERNKTVNGRNRHTLEDNVLQFTVKDSHNPLIKVSISNYDIGEEWIARFSAILNG